MNKLGRSIQNKHSKSLHSCGQAHTATVPVLFVIFYLNLLFLGWGPVFQNTMGLATFRIDEVLWIFLFIVALLLPPMLKKGRILSVPRPFVHTWGIYLSLVCLALLGQAISIRAEALHSLLGAARLLLLTIVFLISYFLARGNGEHIAVTVNLFFVISLGIAVLGILQWLDVGGMKAFVEQHYPRITTYVPKAATAVFGGNPTIMGTFLTIAISFLSGQLFGLKQSVRVKAILWLTLGVLLYALFLTAAKLAIIVGVTLPFYLVALLQRKRFQALIMLAITCASVLWLVDMIAPYALMRIKVSLEPSILGRWETWDYLLKHVLANAPTLVFGTALQAEMPGVSDNAYISELLHYGLIGLLGYIILIFGNLVYFLSLCLRSHEPYERALYAGAFGMLLSIAIVGIAYATINAERLSELFFVLLGITYGTRGRSLSRAEWQCGAGSAQDRSFQQAVAGDDGEGIAVSPNPERQSNGSIYYLCLQATREGQASHAHVREIIKGLEHHGWQVKLFEPKHRSFDKPPRPLGRLLSFLRTQWQLWRSSRPNILYIRAHFATWPSALWARIIDLPTVQEINGPYEDLFIAWPWTRKVARLLIWLMRSQLRWASTIIAVTPQLAEWASKEAGHGKVCVVPNGANTNLFHPQAKTNIELPQPYVVFFGALAPWQGIGIVLEAVKTKGWPSEVRLVIAGDGAERARVEEAARSGQVIYLGRVPYQDMPGIVAHSLAGLSPQIGLGRRSETGLLPLKVFETLACGVPVIVTDWPGQADLVRKNGCGLVIPPDNPEALAEAVAYLYYHPEERSAMGERGHNLVKLEYSWDRCAQKTSEILMTLVASQKEYA